MSIKTWLHSCCFFYYVVPCYSLPHAYIIIFSCCSTTFVEGVGSGVFISIFIAAFPQNMYNIQPNLAFNQLDINGKKKRSSQQQLKNNAPNRETGKYGLCLFVAVQRSGGGGGISCNHKNNKKQPSHQHTSSH